MNELKIIMCNENLREDLREAIKNNNYIKLKSVIDLVLTLFLIPIALPTLFLGMILVKVSSKGPIFFNQNRIGFDNKPFIIYKLRTMNYQNGEVDLNHTIVNDTRIFFAGKLLRLTKIDEIPQLLNVLKGDMSLIGPRPERVELYQELILTLPQYKYRHMVKPGITGLAQINNPKATPKESIQKLEYDLFYVKNLSIKMDLNILFRTIFIVLKLDSL